MNTCVCLTLEWEVKCAYRVRSNRLCGDSCFGLAASDDSNSFLRMWLPAPFKTVWMDGWRVKTEKTKAVVLKAEAKASKWLVYFRIKTGTYPVIYVTAALTLPNYLESLK